MCKREINKHVFWERCTCYTIEELLALMEPSLAALMRYSSGAYSRALDETTSNNSSTTGFTTTHARQ